MKLMAKAPGSVCLELNNDELFSSVAFRFNLRRYAMEPQRQGVFQAEVQPGIADSGVCGKALQSFPFLWGIIEVGPGTNRLKFSFNRPISVYRLD